MNRQTFVIASGDFAQRLPSLYRHVAVRFGASIITTSQASISVSIFGMPRRAFRCNNTAEFA